MPKNEPIPAPRIIGSHDRRTSSRIGIIERSVMERRSSSPPRRADAGNHLGDAEQAHGQRDQADAVRERQHPKGHPALAGIDVHAHGARIRPNVTISKLLSGGPDEMVEAAIRPSTISEKYSADPNFSPN